MIALGDGVAVAGLASSVIAVLVGLKVRTSAAELRTDIAELENRIVQRINGTYVRADICALRMENAASRSTERDGDAGAG